MSKIKVNSRYRMLASERSPEYLASVRKKRRASQARHRMNVARCYQKLKLSVPGVICDRAKDGSPKVSSCIKIGKNMNKADLLYRGKEYISHLEETITKLLDKKRHITPQSTQSNEDESDENRNPVSQRIQNFTNIGDFREDFASRFDMNSQASSYFCDPIRHTDETRNKIKPCKEKTKKAAVDGLQTTKNSASRGTKSKTSSQKSDDQGFVSGGCGSQEYPSTSVHCSGHPASRDNTQAFQTFGSPYGMQYLDFLNPLAEGTFVESSNFYFFVPSTGYSTSYCTTFDEQQSYLPNGVSPMRYTFDVIGENVASTSTNFGHSGSYIQTPVQPKRIYRDVTNDVTDGQQSEKLKILSPSFFLCDRNRVLSHKRQENSGNDDESNAEYEYDETDGTLSPPKICLKGVSPDTKSPTTIVVVEKSSNSQDEGISFVG